MTTSQWDRHELEKQFPECFTLKEVIARIESDFSSRGEVVCEIRVNGMALSEADESKFAENPVTEINEIAVCANQPAALINEALASAVVFIDDLEAACLRTAELFRGTDTYSAQRSFTGVLDGCQWLVDTITHVRGAATGIHLPIAQPERWFEADKVIARVVGEISEAYANQDNVLVADLLEYEVTAALAVWKDALGTERRERDKTQGVL